MMSAALVMAVGGEQTKVRTTTSDRVESGGMTFAQSFGERAGLSADVQTINSNGDASNGMRGGKSSGLVKNSDAPSDASSGAKPNGSVDQRIIGGNETKNVAVTVANDAGKSVVVETSLATLANASDGAQSKTTPGQLPADRGVLQQDTAVKVGAQTGVSQTKTTETAAAIGNEKLPADNVEEAAEASSNASGGSPLGASTKVDTVPGESTALADRSLLSRDEVQSSVQNGNALAGKTLEVASAKKGAKVQESAVGAKAASKTSGATESARTVRDASLGTAVQSANPLPTQVVAQSDAQSNAAGVTAANVSGGVGANPGKFVSAGVTAGVDSTGSKAMAGAGKNGVETMGQGSNPASGATVATGFGVEIDKAAAGASGAGKDADAKGLSAVGAAALVHTAPGNEAVVSGVVPGMASGHTLAEVSGTKGQAGEAGAHAATAQAVLGEQDGSGSVATEMGMSHRTLLATPTALEVGVSNGTQGWLKIRAEMTDGGAVNASLSSASSAGQEMLHRELPALTAYLQEERVSVNTVVVPVNPAAGTDSRFAGSMDGNGSGQAQQSSGQGGGDERQGSVHGTADHADEIPMYVGLNGVGGDGVLSAGTYEGGGSWLNVRA